MPEYEAEESPPPLSSLALGAQSAALVVAPIALFPIVLFQAVDGTESEMAWAVFAMLAVNGITTALQALRFGTLGSGLLVINYPSPTAIPFCIIALQEGGAATLAALILVSGVFQIAVSMKLSLLRRLFTPAFSGAVLILLVITFVPVIFGGLNDVPEGAPAAAGPVCILVTFVLTLGLLMRGTGAWRVWSSLIGIAAGSLVGVAFGVFDFGPVKDAPIAGLPIDGWPGLGLEFGSAFWSLLPAFLFLALIALMQGTSIAMSIQRVSWRRPRAIDYRRVQGISAFTGVGNLLAGVAAVMPVTISPRGTVFAQQTRCASRDVGIVTGALLIAAAFFPQTWSLLIGVPAPVSAVFILVMVSPLMVEGMKLIVQDAPDFRGGLAIGAAMLIGIGLQTGLWDLPIGDVWEAVFQKAFTAGGAALIVLTFFAELGGRRTFRLRTELGTQALDEINGFLGRFSTGQNWSPQMTERLEAAAEETVLVLTESSEAANGRGARRLLLNARAHGSGAELEFVSAAVDAENLEDRLALLTNLGPQEAEEEAGETGGTIGRDASLRLLGHYASSVTHRQYYDLEVVNVRVSQPAA